MKRLFFAAAAAVVTASALHAQAPAPFKLGTFQQQGRTFVGIVRDSVVIDLAAADSAVPGRTAPAAGDMRDVIARYDSVLRARINAIVKAVPTTQGKRPAYVHDLAGLKIRMMGNPMFVDTMNALGGNGVAMGFDQLINALQTGIVDGAENNYPSYVSGQHYRYAKYISQTEHLMIPEILVFSKRIWGTLSPDDQALIARTARQAQQEQRKLWYAMEEKALAEMKAQGVQLVQVSDKDAMRAAVKPVWDKYGAQLSGLIAQIQAVQ